MTDKSPSFGSGRLRIFLSYASEDRERATKLNDRLREDHFAPWIDREMLEAGDRWPQTILEAVSQSEVVVICLSKAATGKDGFLQREISTALASSLLIIPAMFEKCAIPNALIHCQTVELFDDTGYERLKARLTTVGRSVERFYPGGPVHVDAGHYISREEDEKTLTALGGPPFTMLVQGPVQCGKSSLLTRLQKRAREMDIATTWFHPHVTANSPRQSQSASSNTQTARDLAEHLQNEWGLLPPRKRTIGSIAQWLMKALEPTASKHRLLIIDDLGSLGLDAAESWLRFIREIQNRRASGVRMSVAVGLTHSFGADLEFRQMHLDSDVFWYPKVELNWFTETQVRKLETRVSRAAASGDELYGLFAGQPYLTHAAAHEKSFRESVRIWQDGLADLAAERVRDSEFFRHHQAGILWAMMGPTTKPDADTRRILQSFIDACSLKPTIDLNHAGFFRRAKLINQDSTPSLSIYPLMVEYFRQIIGSGK